MVSKQIRVCDVMYNLIKSVAKKEKCSSVFASRMIFNKLKYWKEKYNNLNKAYKILCRSKEKNR